jgi:polyferredoxin
MEQPLHDVYADSEAYRDHIATVDDKGRRVWIYPKKPKGRFTSARTVLSIILLIILFGGPFVKVDGDPFMLFNVLERRFILFGINFAPQDFHLFVLAMLTMIVFITLFTVVFGRLFCGWICPQTIFMEGVFRKIEYLIEGDANAQRRLNNSSWTPEKTGKKLLKHSLFFTIALLISHTFWAYIIGMDQVIATVTSPISQNVSAFSGIIVFSFVFYFVFSYLREQVCIAICPYGRLQGVLLDQNSIVIHYDFVRGEPRGKIHKTKPLHSPIHQICQDIEGGVTEAFAGGMSAAPEPTKQRAFGDCIDCKMCVHVCPTGIDIRNGTQLECINCTACIDACDEIMEKVNRQKD